MADPSKQPGANLATTELTAAGRRRRSRRRRLALILVATLLLVTAALGLVATRHHWFPDGAEESDGPVSWAGLGLIFVGLAIEVWGLLRDKRLGTRTEAWNSPIHDLPSRQRRTLRRHVQGRLPLDPESEPLARQFALAMIRDYRRTKAVVIGLIVMMVGNLLQHSVGFMWALILALILLQAVNFVILRRGRTAARAFLAAPP